MLWSRKVRRTHREQLMDELTQSYGHLRMAAGQLAGGAAEHLTPQYDRARQAANRGLGTTKQTFTPLYEQVRHGAFNARKETVVAKKSRWPMLVGLLAAGAAAGAAGAMAARRRRAAMAEWDEYEPLGGLETSYGSSDMKNSATKKLSDGAASVAGSVSAGAGKLADSLHRTGKPGSGDGMSDPMSDMSDNPAKHNSRP